MSKYVFIDFEYNSSPEPKLNLVCATLLVDGEYTDYWLHDDNDAQSLIDDLNQYNREGYTLVAYAVTAEARSLLALGLDPLKFKWIDLFLEWRHITNKRAEFCWGKQLIKGKRVVTSPPRNKFQREEGEELKLSHAQVEHSLAACCFKLIGVVLDLGIKDTTRDLIISAPDKFTEEEKVQIMAYCRSDVQYLPRLLKRFQEIYKGDMRTIGMDGKPVITMEHISKGVKNRSEYAVRTAMMEDLGYPIGRVELKAFSDRVPELIWTLQNEINELFPEYQIFKMKPNKQFSVTEANVRLMLAKNLSKYQRLNWTATKGGKTSLSSKAFEKFFKFDHGFPQDNPIAQFMRFLKFKKQLYGFVPSATAKRTFWDSVGSDDRVRPYFGIYGSQTGRSQPSSTGFLFLKSAWLRALCVPPKGKCMISIDYGSQEFLVAGLVSEDMNMVNAYLSGDPYLAFAKLAGAVPQDGTKVSHPEERNLFKSTVLGLSYGMGAKGLASKLSFDTGEEVSETKAKELSNSFKQAFPKYEEWKTAIEIQYHAEGCLKLPCGWTLWGDNDSKLSLLNFPIQGAGATIMRKAVALAQDRGLNVVFTLHDALYIEADILTYDEDLGLLAECMYEAFQSIFEGKWKDLARIKLDADVWSPELIEGGYMCATDVGLIETKVKSIYIDPRSKEEYERFKPYFEPLTEEDYEI